MPKTVFTIFSAAAFAAAALTGARAETLVGSNVDSRVVIGLDVADAALAEKAPEGWTPIAFPNGPLAGADLLVILIDRKLDRDADGKARTPASMRAVALAGLATKPEMAPRLFLYRIYATPEEYDPYGVAQQAEILRLSSETGPAGGPRERAETWTVRPAEGGEMSVSITFKGGTASWGPAEAMPHSAADPEFYRIYRYDQLVDLVTSKALDKPLEGTYRLEADIAEWGAVLDGTEELRAILDNPVYVRQVYLP